MEVDGDIFGTMSRLIRLISSADDFEPDPVKRFLPGDGSRLGFDCHSRLPVQQ